jgi:hypothetical protein
LDHSIIRYRVTLLSDIGSGINRYRVLIEYRHDDGTDNFFVSSGAPCRDQDNNQNDSDSNRSGDREMDADDLRDYADQHPSIHPTSSADLGTYARFLQSMPDYFDMTQEVFTRAVDALPGPSLGPPPPGISIHEAIQASYIYQYHIRYRT